MPRARLQLQTAYPPAGLGIEAAAAYIGVSATTLRNMSADGSAPRPVNIGARRIYRRADLDAWLESLPIDGEEAAAREADKWREAFG